MKVEQVTVNATNVISGAITYGGNNCVTTGKVAYSGPIDAYIGYLDIRDVKKKTNCQNCGAPVNRHRYDCEYCGTRY